MGSLPLSDGISSPPATAVTLTVPYGSSFATTAVSTASGFGTAIVTSTNMSADVLPTIRKKPRLEWRMASETARLAALVESLPWTSTPMPISVIQRTRAIGFLLSLECGKFHHHQFINHQKSKREDEGDYPGNACDFAAQR